METPAPSASILIVDDTPQNLRLLSQILAQQGYTVRVASNGLQAIQSVQKKLPDLILLDVMMPEMDGFATCAHFKADAATRDIPVIFLSALDSPQDKVKAFQAGGVDYITKPFESSEVLARITTHLQLRGMQRQLQAQNQQLAAEIAERRRTESQLQLLHDLDMTILGMPTPESIAMAALSRLRQGVPCQRLTVLELQPNALPRILAQESLADFNTGWIAGENFTPTDIQDLARFHYAPDLDAMTARPPWQERLYATGARACLSIPLPFQQQIIGALQLEADRPHAFTPEQIAMATQIAIVLAIGIHQARMSLDLQQEVAERRRAEATLQAYTQELEASNAELDAFAHTVAHDLKTPLSVIIGFSSILETRFARFSQEQVQENLHRIAHTSYKMRDIINELLLLAGIRKQGDVPLGPLVMEEIVNEAQNRLKEMIKEHHATVLAPEQWPVALGYRAWVEEIWVNYLSNALKYGGRPEQDIPPHVELGWDVVRIENQESRIENRESRIENRESRIENQESRIENRESRIGEHDMSIHDSGIHDSEIHDTVLRFWVQDNGPGLTAEEQARLFTQFTRLHQVRVEGHGLGLSIVQRIAERLGGQVGVESVVGEGSRFYFTLPAAPESDADKR
jgi:signal transduction histidine kinase/DNA-binding NarL/FixJ family response regulator